MCLPDTAPPPSIAHFLTDDSELGALIRGHDWSTSPLGAPETWPQSLRSVVALILASKLPMFVAWGPELGFLYNDAYAEVLGAKHPQALGTPFKQIWAEIWPDIAPLVDAAMAGEATYRENLPLLMNRKGFDEPTWFTFSYSPLRDERGDVAGMYCACTETTRTVIAERAARESEARFRNMADHAPVMMWVTDPAGACTYLNARWYAFTGQPEGAGEGLGWLDAVHPDDRPIAERAFLEANAERRDYRVDFRLRRADGVYRWTIDAAAARVAEDGSFLGYVGSVIDIEDRKDVEIALRDSEARLRLAIDGAQLGTWDWDLRTLKGSWSGRTMEILGVDREHDITAEERNATIHPDDRDEVWKTFAAAAQAGSELVSEYRAVRPSGEIRWIASRGALERDAAGTPTRAAGIVLDITEQKAAEAALRESEARLRELNDTLEELVAARSAERDRLWNLSQDMLARADYSGMMSAVSPAWTQVLGWSPAELLSRGYASFMHPDDMPPTLAAIGRMGETRQPARFENRIATVDGGWKPIEWTVAPEPDGLNFIAVGRDLSAAKAREAELEAAQDALRQSQKLEAMGQLTGGVAHDVNNLLTPIMGSLDLLRRRGIGGEREQRMIDGALQAADRAKTLVQRLLAFARRQPLQPVPVDIGELIAGMAELVASTSGPRVRVDLDVPRELPAALADPNQLEMAVLNLAVNARDAMADGGSLTIAAKAVAVEPGHRLALAAGRYIRLSVADSGSGMDETTLKRAVEPFFSTKGIGKGTGLGLSMVHGLAAQLGGALDIQSKLGLGTNVDLWLPASSEGAQAPEAPAADSAQRAVGTVLIVDDEELVRISTADMLADLGYAVVEAASAEEALRLVEDGLSFDMLVTDHLMAGMTGTDLARAVRARRPTLPVLIVSGYADVEGIAPDLPRMTKPFRRDDLAASLAALTPAR